MNAHFENTTNAKSSEPASRGTAAASLPPIPPHFARERHTFTGMRRVERQARRRMICAVVVTAVLHLSAFYYLSASTVDVGLNAAGAPTTSIRVSLISATPTPPVLAPTPIAPSPPTPAQPVVRPRPKHIAPKPVMATHHDATRTVNRDDAPPPQVMPASPPVATPAATLPTPRSAARAAPLAAAPAPGKMLALPKTLDASALKELGCSIPAPEYPAAARRLGESGTVRLLIKIGIDGKFSGVQIAKSSGYSDLDNAAQDAISRGSCNPYVQNGTPVSVTAVQPITFNLDN